MFQGTKYSCGRQVEWEAYKHANFYAEVHKYFEDMGWLGFSAMSEKEYSFLLVNEFYKGLLLYTNEYSIPTRFQDVSLYMFFDGEERIISQKTIGQLIGCEHYDGPYNTHFHFSSNNVWDTLAI